jgi:hypothetical protein
MPKKPRKVRVGKAAANGKRLPKRNASAVAKGAAYAVLAGRPSKQAVTAVFGKTGYALSWVLRADCLGITPEGLCGRFKTDPNRVKKLWAELTVGNARAAEAWSWASCEPGDGLGGPRFENTAFRPKSPVMRFSRAEYLQASQINNAEIRG